MEAEESGDLVYNIMLSTITNPRVCSFTNYINDIV